MTPAYLTAEQSSTSASPVGQHSKLSRLASFPAALVALLMMLAVFTVRDRFADPDMWWHLKDGQVIATTHAIPTTDVFSYTTNHHATIPHEWLGELLIYAAYYLHGYSGLMLWDCAFTGAILLAGFYLCTLYSGSQKLGFLAALIIWFFGTVGFAVRPQIIGYLLLIGELAILHLGRTRDARWFYVLPPLFALWVNCHGSFLLGLVVAAAYLVSSFATRGIGSIVPAQWTASDRRTLAIAIGISVPALLLNPVGIRLVLYPVEAMFMPSIGLAEVSEWQPLAFTEARAFGLLAVIAVLLILPAISRARLFVHELIFLALATYSAAAHHRLLFAFGILVAPSFARMLGEVWSGIGPEREHPFANLTLIAAALLISVAVFPSPASLQSQVRNFSPVRAVDFIRSHNLSGPMLNEWGDGGYLLWAMPEHPVFIDGRGDIYEWSGAMASFLRWETLAEPPNLLLDRYHIQFCVLRTGSHMNTAISLLPNWRRVYSDNVSVVFVRTSPSAS